MIELTFSVVVTLALWGLTTGWIKLHRARMQMLHFHRDRFFKTAEAIVRDETVDDAILVHLKNLAEELDKPRALNALILAVAAVEQEIRDNTVQSATTGHLPAHWPALLWDFFLAISYTRPMPGLLLRNRLANLIDPRADDLNTVAIDQKVRSFSLQPA